MISIHSARAALIAALVILAGLLGGASGPAHPFCFEEAAGRYGVPEVLLRTIAELESGFDPEAAGWNADGSVDVGLMQINSWWESRLGPERWIRVCTDPCYNVLVGAWVLRDCLDRYGYTVDGVGCYNARSPEKRALYSQKILRSLLEQVAQRQARE